ncbi:MAG: hypothetical protein ACU0B8_08815 [Pseudooceanicola nanhaiensis]
MPDQKTILLHITKTAGGTLKTALQETPGINVEFLYGPQDLERLQAADLSPVDMIYGHSIFGVDASLDLPEARYSCFMRHPVTRTISHYYHLRNVEKGPVGDKIRESEDIDDFFARMQHWEFSDLMTKIISGIGAQPAPEGLNVFREAVKNIEARFDFIGFQEYFPLSLRRLSEHLGVEIRPARDVNVGRYALNDIREETIRRIEAINRADMKLYKYCLDRFL